MMMCVIFLDDEDFAQHVAVFDYEETMTDLEIASYAAEGLDITIDEKTNYNILKAGHAKEGDVWLRVKDYELEGNETSVV